MTVGLNTSCGYSSSNSLILKPVAGVLPAYSCASYLVKSIQSQLYFAPLPPAYATYVLTALANAAAPVSATAANPVISSGALVAWNGGSFGTTTVTSPWIPTSLFGIGIPAWSFEPTTNPLAGGLGALRTWPALLAARRLPSSLLTCLVPPLAQAQMSASSPTTASPPRTSSSPRRPRT